MAVENLGEYLKRLRLEQRFSQREVEERSGVSNSYLAQIERGDRRPPSAEILRKLAPVYNVPVRDLLEAAGLLDEGTPGITEEEEVEMAFQFVMNDPRYKSGTRLSGPITLEVKRFIVEMYEKATGKKLLS